MSNKEIVHSIIEPSKTYEYIDDGNPKQGGMKDVYFSEDRSYVVAIYRKELDNQSIERLRRIVTQYKDSFFNAPGGEYYENIYSWPTDVIQTVEGKIGIIVPCYSSNFFFAKGFQNNNMSMLKGEEKQGKWFASPKYFVKGTRFSLDENEVGDWLSYFQICLHISRGVKRLHAAGLAHSDLSYKNVLIDPVSKSAAIIDIDGLVVPGLFPPEVLGTPDFIAPEVVATKHLAPKDANRKTPSRLTDLHALPVLIYMYLLHRHPLRGGNFFGDIESDEEENLLMGSKALFIEHPKDKSNRNFKREYGDDLDAFRPWTDLQRTPYHIVGPYLKALFDRAFIDGLHNPQKRPTADQWEQALVKSADLKLRCANANCQEKWFLYYADKKHIHCPFCHTRYQRSVPIIDFYYQPKPTEKHKKEDLRLVVHHNCGLFKWHSHRRVIRNERLKDEDKQRQGYFIFHEGRWLLRNEAVQGMRDLKEKKDIPINGLVELKHGSLIALGTGSDKRLMSVRIVNT